MAWIVRVAVRRIEEIEARDPSEARLLRLTVAKLVCKSGLVDQAIK